MFDPAVGPQPPRGSGNGTDGVGAGGAATEKSSGALFAKLDPFKAAIDAMLTADIEAPRKQRHSARRILARLAGEHGAQHLSYSTLRDYVRVWRAQIDVEAGRRVEVFVPQEHAPGAEAEIDFGEVWVILARVKTKCHIFAFRRVLRFARDARRVGRHATRQVTR